MSRHWVLTTWNAKAMVGVPAFIVAPRARCALWSRRTAVHLVVHNDGAPWIGIDSSERTDGAASAYQGLITSVMAMPFSRLRIIQCGSSPPGAPARWNERIHAHRKRAQLWCAACVRPQPR